MKNYEMTIAFRESPRTRNKPFPERKYIVCQGIRDAQFSPWIWQELAGSGEFTLDERNQLEALSTRVNTERRRMGIL